MPLFLLFLLFLLSPCLVFAGADFGGGVGGGGGGGGGAMVNESSTIVAPGSATAVWVRTGGGVTDPAVGVSGGCLAFDLDDDQAADCTVCKAGGVVTFDCNNTNFIAQPGQTNGDIKFYDSGGTEIINFDPDTNVFTTSAPPIDFNAKVAKKNVFREETGASVTLTGADCHGGTVYNSDADPLTVNLCDGEAGGGQSVRVFDAAGGAITVDVNDVSETIVDENGVALSSGEAIILESGYGNFAIFESVNATTWRITGSKGVLTEETP